MRRHGTASEKRVAKKLGARLTPASGALDGAKADMNLGRFKIEAKSTVNLTLALESQWLVKISQEAVAGGQIPAITLSFVTPEGKPRMQRNAEWVAIPMWVFAELTSNG